MRDLTKFMNNLLENPIIKNSQILYDFISIDAEAKFQERQKAYNKLSSPQSLAEVKSLTGDMTLNLSKDSEIYYSNIKDNTTNNINLLKKITQGCKQLQTMIIDVSYKMKEVSDNFDELFKNSTKFYDNDTIISSYNLLKKLMHNWCITEKKEAELFGLDIREHFKFVRKKYKSMRELINKTEKVRNEFMKASEKLDNRKEDLFKRQDVAHMELDPKEDKKAILANKELAFSKMLPKESLVLDNHRKLYSFYLNSIIWEFERIKNVDSNQYRHCILEYTTKNQGILNIFIDTLNGILNFFSKSGKGVPGEVIMIH